MNGPVLAALIAVVGWSVTHFFTLRAQRKNFEHQVFDRARMEIVRALRTYEEWLGRLAVLLLTLESEFIAERMGLLPPSNWQAARERITELTSNVRATTDWSIALEEYEILFPEVRDVRGQLLLRQNDIFKFATDVRAALTEMTLFPGPLPAREARVTKLKETLPSVWEQQSLLDDIRIHLQNASLSKIVHRRVPFRTPTDPDVLRIVPGHDGKLLIMRHGEVPPPSGVSVRHS